MVVVRKLKVRGQQRHSVARATHRVTTRVGNAVKDLLGSTMPCPLSLCYYIGIELSSWAQKDGRQVSRRGN